MTKIRCSITTKASPEAVFPLISDPVRFPGLFSGTTRVEQVSNEGRCVGARYLMLMRVGSIDAGGVFRITEWREPERVAWVSEQGVSQSGSVTSKRVGEGRTEVRIDLDYCVPGWRIPAYLVEHLTRHVVERRVQATLLSIKRVAEFDRELFGRGTGAGPRGPVWKATSDLRG